MANQPAPADQELIRDLTAAARTAQAWEALEAVAKAGFAAGVTREAMLRASGAALDTVVADLPEGTEDPADDALRDLMDRLEGWCPPGAELEPLPPK
jgi:phage-related minor tail protein